MGRLQRTHSLCGHRPLPVTYPPLVVNIPPPLLASLVVTPLLPPPISPSHPTLSYPKLPTFPSLAPTDGTAVDDGPVKDGPTLLLDIWNDFVAAATENVLNPNPALLPPPSPQDYPPLAAGTTALPPMASLTLTAGGLVGLPPPAPTVPSTPAPRGKSALGYKGPKKGLQVCTLICY